MVVFSPLKILISVVSALLYGAILALTINFVSAFFDFIRMLFLAFKKDIEMPKECKSASGSIVNRSPKPIAITFFGIVLFGIGFSVISFITLDGNIRLYTLLASILGWHFSEVQLFSKARVSVRNAMKIIISKLKKLCQKLRLQHKNAHFFKKSQKNALTNDHRPP